MYRCVNCGVTVKTMTTCCPLCHMSLEGDETGTEQTYPFICAKKSCRVIIESGTSLTIMAIQVLINLLVSPGILWCIPACATVLYSWLIVILARTGRMRNGVTWYYHLLPVSLLMILYNLYVIEAGPVLSWFPTYGLAFCIALFLLINNGWMLYSRRSVFNILPSQLFICILGLIPIYLVLLKVIAFSWANMGTAALSLGTVITVLIIYRTRTRMMLRRYFYT